MTGRIEKSERVVRRRTSRLRIAIAWSLIAFTFLVFSLTYLFYPAVRARSLFGQVERLELGQTNYEDAEALAQRIGATPTPYGPCSRSDCEWVAEVDNAKLPRWWRGAGEAFRAVFEVKESKVVRKSFGYGICTLADGPFTSSVGLTEREHWYRQHRPVSVEAGWYSTDRYPYWQFRVNMIPGASVQDSRLYTVYNYRCMWKFRGGKNGRELLPVAASMALFQP
jgi:hypothetical protein